MTYYYIYYINKYIFDYLHHRRRKPRCSLAQIPRCTLILIDVHRTFTPRSLYTCSSKTEAQSCDSRAFLRLFPSMSLIRIHPKAASCTDTLKGNPSKVSFNVVFRSCPLFLANNFEESAADTQLLLGQLEKVNPPFVVRKVCRSGRRNTLLCTADSNSSKRKKK